MVEPEHKMSAPSGLRDFSIGRNPHIFLAVVYDTVKIYQVDLSLPRVCIKLQSTPRSARLSPCSKYFYIHQNTSSIDLYSSEDGVLLQTIRNNFLSVKSIRFSQNSHKIIYGNTQRICLWNVLKGDYDVRTQNWRNINCYDLNEDGSRFAIGNYNGSIYVVDFIEAGKCSQIQIKRHKTCVAAICFFREQLISVSHDGIFFISTISAQGGEKTIAYRQMKLKSIPREIEWVGDRFYMFSFEGMTWFNKYESLTGFNDGKTYRPMVDQDGRLVFVSSGSGYIQWWPASAFKTPSEVQREQIEKEQIQKQIREREREHGKQNRVAYRVVYKKQ